MIKWIIQMKKPKRKYYTFVGNFAILRYEIYLELMIYFEIDIVWLHHFVNNTGMHFPII